MQFTPNDTSRKQTTFEGEIATYWFDDGILVSRSKSTLRTVENITGNIALVKSITNNKKKFRY